MEKELNNYLRENERVRWQSKPDDFPLLEQGVKFQILRKWIVTVALSAGILALYVHNNGMESMGFMGLVALIALTILISPFSEQISLRSERYWITDQRAVLMTRDKTFYYMELSQIDAFEVVSDVANQDCLVLGSVLFPEIHKQLRWRACHPKMDLQASENQDCALGMVFYGISNADAAVSLLNQRIPAKAA